MRYFRDLIFNLFWFSIGLLIFIPIMFAPNFLKIRNDAIRTVKFIQPSQILFLSFFGLLGGSSYFREYLFTIIGPIGWFLKILIPNRKNFYITNSTIIEGAINLKHPFSTIINAKYIGNNLTIRQLTTIGNKTKEKRDVPTILSNVELGANVSIIGDVTIGENSIIGIGAVVFTDLPSNKIVVGFKSRILK
jgi:serine O-acetyltransferase